MKVIRCMKVIRSHVYVCSVWGSYVCRMQCVWQPWPHIHIYMMQCSGDMLVMGGRPGPCCCSAACILFIYITKEEKS